MSKPTKDKNFQIPTEVLIDFLTQSELRMLKNRWKISQLLQEGQTIRSISEEVKVGTDTVVRVSKMLDGKNITGKILRKKDFKIKSNTPWIFGKSD